MLRRFEVRLGQRYVGVSHNRPNPPVWRVVNLYRHDPGIPHAALSRSDNPSDVKTLACTVLADAGQFRLIDDQLDHA